MLVAMNAVACPTSKAVRDDIAITDNLRSTATRPGHRYPHEVSGARLHDLHLCSDLVRSGRVVHNTTSGL
ncbi:hypothetical protein D3C85_1615700 [compost metagenome]